MKTRALSAVLALASLVCGSSSVFAQAAQSTTPQTGDTQQSTTRQSQKKAARTDRSAAPATPSRAGIPGSWKQVPIPVLPEFKAQQPTRIELPNGMTIFLQENHELPLISGTARIRGGYVSEPASKVGLVEMYGEVWRTGGTESKTGDQMDDFLEARAAKIETDGSADFTSISFDCLKGDFNDVFQLFTELLRQPAFRPEKLELAKNQMNTGIARRNDNSGSIISRESGFIAYGKNNPYVRIPEYYTVAAITRDDLANWHKQYVQPNNIMIGVEGDFDSKQMEATLRKAFESWAKGPELKTPEVAFNPAKPGIYVADKNDVNQSEIRMVELGIDRHNPDYFAVSVFNELFGGGFSSRLFSNLRTKRGLAYSVGGGIGSAFDHPGITRLSMGTKTESTVDAIRGMFEQIDDLGKNPPTEAELKRAKDSVLNSFIFNFDTPGKVLREKMTYEFYGYPLDFLDKYRREVEKVTIADVDRVAKKYLHKDQLAIVIVGNASGFQQGLSGLGTVQPIDISIPESAPSGEAGAASAAKTVATTNPEGKALIAKFVKALGGEAKVNSVKAVREKLTARQKTPQGDMDLTVEQTMALPDRTAQLITLPMGQLKRVITPDAAFIVFNGQTQDLPPSQKTEAQGESQRDMINVAQHANDASYTFSGQGNDLTITPAGGKSFTWTLDPQTGLVAREAYSAVGFTGPTQREITYSDWKAVDGITLPFKSSMKENGQDSGHAEAQSIEINPQVDPQIFARPK